MFVLVQDHMTACILADFAGLWTARALAFTNLFISWLCSFRKICTSWWKINLCRQPCSQISPNLVDERTITAQWEHVDQSLSIHGQTVQTRGLRARVSAYVFFRAENAGWELRRARWSYRALRERKAAHALLRFTISFDIRCQSK